MQLKPIYTESENCQDCYKCVRNCPVKAICVENNKANIIPERCIYCGKCTQVCPTGAKKIRDGVNHSKIILRNYSRVILSLAPSYVSEFENIPEAKLISAIKRLGFSDVSETALGAELVSGKLNRFLTDAQPGVYISSICPVVIEYIQKYSKEHIPSITPFVSPMIAHAKMLKELYGEGTMVVFAGPCICKKLEADHFNELIEAVITFKDLRLWLDKEGIDINKQPIDKGATFVPYRSDFGSLYPIEGGMLPELVKDEKKITKMSFSDLNNVKDVIKNLKTKREHDSLFLELLACQGGCINGPAKLSQTSLAIKRYNIANNWESSNKLKTDFSHLDLGMNFQAYQNTKTYIYKEEEIRQALEAIGKFTDVDELNCSGCGYDTCREFAKAMLEGRAEENMCVSYMRKIAHDKATTLLHKIPAGVLFVDANLNIVDMNRSCADMLGEDILKSYETSSGLNGIPVGNICDFEHLLRNVLKTGEEISEKHIRSNGKLYLLSVYNIQPHHLVFGLLQNTRESYAQKA